MLVDIVFLFICSAMVLIMTPALGFFYGGLSRRKNVINIMIMSFTMIGIATLIWISIGYSLSFSGKNLFIGNISKMFLNGLEKKSKNGVPELSFALFQMMFSIIALAIISGAVGGRMKFSAFIVFAPLWLIFVYCPLAHMVWDNGFLEKIGSIDFAGGNVVHISSGTSALILAKVLGKRVDYSTNKYSPHNVPLVVIGASLLWFGWIGFNSGSELKINNSAVLSVITTCCSGAAAMLTWMGIEKLMVKKITIVGACTGAILGLVAITPNCGYVPIWSSMLIGAFVSPVCYFSMNFIKETFKIDDALDVFACHGIGGIYGGIMTGIFATKNLSGHIGLIYGNFNLLVSQLESIVFTIAYVSIITLVIIWVIKLFTNIRVSTIEEGYGLDYSEHGEKAYPSFTGLDA